jgi:hypothetical protein
MYRDMVLRRQARSYRAFKALERLIPNLLKTIDDGDSNELTVIYTQVMLFLHLYDLDLILCAYAVASGRCNWCAW